MAADGVVEGTPGAPDFFPLPVLTPINKVAPVLLTEANPCQLLRELEARFADMTEAERFLITDWARAILQYE